jgi:hypothetical protein
VGQRVVQKQILIGGLNIRKNPRVLHYPRVLLYPQGLLLILQKIIEHVIIVDTIQDYQLTPQQRKIWLARFVMIKICGRRLIDMLNNWWETEVEYRNTLQQILDSGIFTYQHERDALEYAISLIQKEIDGEVE